VTWQFGRVDGWKDLLGTAGGGALGIGPGATRKGGGAAGAENGAVLIGTVAPGLT
jgi:hypothetical protein